MAEGAPSHPPKQAVAQLLYCAVDGKACWEVRLTPGPSPSQSRNALDDQRLVLGQLSDQIGSALLDSAVYLRPCQR